MTTEGLQEDICEEHSRMEIVRKRKDLRAKTRVIEEPSNQQLLDAYENMIRARMSDEKAIILYKQNKCHFQIGCAGHEAVQVAAAQAMRSGYDWAYPYYRDMAFVTSWGMSTKELMLNAMNKAADPNSGGRQMPMHYGHKDLNIVSQSSPTGTQFLQAVGAAKASQFRKTDQVVYVSAGEGTTAQGDYHEALNWAAREKLPVIFVIQDNQFAISVHISEQIAGESVAEMSKGYEGLEVIEVDGLDYWESYEAMQEAVARARAGEGPSVVVAHVVRLQSHSISDNQAKYRTPEDIAKDRQKDPIGHFKSELIARGVASREQLDKINARVSEEITQAAEWAEQQADPRPDTYSEHVYVDTYPRPDVEEREANGEEFFMVDALNKALDEELARDPDALMYGQDVAYGKGGVFAVTTGLTDKHGPEKCFNSPLAEASIIGTAIGLASVGLKPIVEIQFGDYIWTGMMQIRNELAMMNYRSNGAFTCPAVVRVAVGGYIHGALYHSQNIAATFAHTPGLVIIEPSNATDAKGLLKSAIRCPDPVLFLEHKGLYRQVYAKGPIGGADDLIPIGVAKTVRKGSDATVITWGALVNKSKIAAEKLAEEGYEVEVIDLRTIAPLDVSSILASVQRTGRALIVHEDAAFMGFGAEVAARISESAFEYLDAPVMRVAGKNTPVPHAPVLEAQVLPQIDDIVKGLKSLLRY